jgi:hypothetical protein
MTTAFDCLAGCRCPECWRVFGKYYQPNAQQTPPAHGCPVCDGSPEVIQPTAADLWGDWFARLHPLYGTP